MRRRLLAALALLGLCGFVALGVWQIQRRTWKLDLIARVDARVHARPAPLPPTEAWPGLKPQSYEYRHVRATGTYLPGHDTLVQAVTERGAGYWVLTPLRMGSKQGQASGTVLVNRGFVPTAMRSSDAVKAPSGPVTITGLLRVSEPGGGFLRSNDPAAHRWYSRDVAAIARAQGLGKVAPFFIDADARKSGDAGTNGATDRDSFPVGGLTVIQFPNNHLVYALTWFGLAALCGFAAVKVLQEKDRNRA